MMEVKKGNLLLIIVISLCLNLLVMLGIAKKNPAYLVHYRFQENPDAVHYVLLGENFWTKGFYSRESGFPYTPDILRTPIYPLFAGGVQALCGCMWPLYVLQGFFSGVTGVFIYLIACLFISPRLAIIVGLLYVTDVLVITLNNEAMSEGLSMLFFFGAIAFLLRKVAKYQNTKKYLIVTIMVTGLLFGLSILTRPAVLYFPLCFACFLVVVNFFKNRRVSICFSIGLVTISYLAVMPWIYRNSKVFDLPRLTTNDSITLLYFAGAGAYQVKFGIDREDAQKEIVKEYNVVSYFQASNHWKANRDVSTMDRELRAAAYRIFKRYPLEWIQSSLIGVIKALIAHNVDDLAYMFNITWDHPGLDKLLDGDISGFVRGLVKNSFFLLFVLCWQMTLEISLIVLSAIGAGSRFVVRSNSTLIALLLGIIAYFALTIGVVGIDAYARHRIGIVPPLYILGIIGFATCFNSFSGRKIIQ
jgi:hypothetical protein